MSNSLASETAPSVVVADAAVHPVTGRPARTRMAALLLVATCLPVLGSVLIAPVLPSISAAYRSVAGSEVLVPLVLTVPSLLIGVTAPFAGSIVDRIGRRRLLLLALLVYAAVGTAPLYLGSLIAVVISRVGVGIAEAAIITCCTALLTDYFSGQRRNRYLSLSTLLTSLSGAVFLVLGGALGEQGWRTPFALYAVSLLLFVPVLIAVWEPRRADAGLERTKPSRIPVEFLLMPLIVGFVTGIVFFSVVVEMPYVFTALGLKSTGAIGALSGINSLSAAVGALSFRWTAGLGLTRLVPSALGLAGLGLIVVWTATSVPVALAGAIITSLGTGLLIPCGLTWTVSRLSIDQRGRAVGRGTGVLFIGQFICPVLVVAIQGIVGGLSAAMGALGIFSISAAIVFGLLLSRQPQPDLRRSVV